LAPWNSSKHHWELSAAERDVRAARRGGPPEALHVDVSGRGRLLTVYMDDEVDHVFPADAVPGLASQPVRVLRAARVLPGGQAIEWPELGVRLEVPTLLAHGPAGAPKARWTRRAGDKVAAPEPAPAGRSPAPEGGAARGKPRREARPDAGMGRGDAEPYPTVTAPPAMAIVHGTWIPDAPGDFVQGGAFHVWVEAVSEAHGAPTQLNGPALDDLLAEAIGGERRCVQASAQLWLPSADGLPLPSPEAGRWLDRLPPDEADLRPWRVSTRILAHPLEALPALRFSALQRPDELQLGADLAFWIHAFHALKAAVVRDQYVPALRLAPGKGGKRGQPAYEVRATWEFLSPALDAELRRLAEGMPAACRAGTPDGSTPQLAEAEPLLRHCAAVVLNRLMTGLSLPQSFLKRIDGTFLAAGVQPPSSRPGAPGPAISLETYQAWRGWRERLGRAHTAPAFDLAFQLIEPEDEAGAWALAFQAVSRQDPSLRLSLADYWALDARGRTKARAPFGGAFEREALLLLGQAARMVPAIWRGLETDRPARLSLSTAEAHAFLKGDAWLLEDAGFRVLVPAWWTPEGRRRVRARLVPASPPKGKAAAASAGPGEEGWLDFRYQLAIGDEPVTPEEWRSLVAAKASLVRFRGQWIELDPEQMARVQALVEQAGDRPQKLSALDLVRIAAEEADGDVALDEGLEAIVERLADPRALAPVPPPAGLKASLREYQRRGLDWLVFLDSLGLNGCLADDMGLGKTMQVIARLVHERETEPGVGPTLLVAPTSVVGNWQKELARFAPGLRALLHHGALRQGEAAGFAAAAGDHDVVITSYALVRRDEALFAGVRWRRIVLDEAQNIKNPAAAQTRAIRKLKSEHRLALTGTPVENRLLDLWSLFDFLNPGYMGKEAAFRKAFETPIQRDGDARRAELLRRLTGPLVLRRVKTDPAIIRDLPEKVEQKLYCPLTPEQASLYEAVVQEAAEATEAAEGIRRKGIMLATLTKLKQVCNHPAQLLQDGSAFDPARSHKLARLTEHAKEILQGGESLLVFTQFAELGGQLERHLRHVLGADVYFLHGGTPREARERMIGAFQDPAAPPAVFVLSLKAGGVGITLTRANHVFHFDRWWNPAVEEQATDRAFRIGQTRNVFVHKFVTLGTLEERIDAMLEDKRRLASSVVGTDESWLAGLDNEAFKALIALDRSAVMA
jgi:hypothetical protein